MTFLTNSLQIKHIPGNSFIRLLLIVSFVLILSLSLISTSFAAGMPVTLGDGVDPSSTILGPGYSATNTNSFTLRTSTSTSVVTNVLVNLNAGGRNDGLTWSTSTGAASSIANNPWTSITYGNGIFVAVSSTSTNNSVMTSPDGNTWTLRTATTTNSWTAVTFGNNLFVAVAGSGVTNAVMTSPDGITWTPRTTPNNSWQSVTFGNNLFVAVAVSGTGNRVMTSPDGITWTSRTSAADNNWYELTYGNGLFVAVSNNGAGTVNDRVMTSPDGITWTARSATVDNSWYGIAYGNGLFVSASFSGNIMTSPDGITWTSRTAAAANQWASLTYGNGLFAVVSSSGTGNRVMTSPDGITWTSRTSAADNSWTSVSYGNGMFVAVSNTGTGNRIMTSTSGTDPQTSLGQNNGITWSTTTIPTSSVVWRSIAFGNGMFVAVGGTATNQGVMTSPDGVTWSVQTTPISSTWQSVIYGDGVFVALNSGTGTSTIMTSPDGISWTVRSSLANGYWRSIAYGNGTYVAVASAAFFSWPCTSNCIMTSTNTVDWIARAAGTNDAFSSVVYGNGLFVTGSDGAITPCVSNCIQTSPDGITWTVRSVSTNGKPTKLAYGKGLYIASVAGSGTFFSQPKYSFDGISWSTLSTTFASGTSAWTINYGNGLFVAVAASTTLSNGILVSSDGLTWASATPTFAGDSWNQSAYGNGKFVVVGTNNFLVSNSGTYYNNSEFYKGISKIEITNDDGSTSYATLNNPSRDQLSFPVYIPVSTTTTQYRIRITPKSHAGMPSSELGDTYPIKAKVTSITSLTGVAEGEDSVGATTTIDNLSNQIRRQEGPWVSRASAADYWWSYLTYANGLFVAVAQTGFGNRVMTSPDGITWTLRISAAENNWVSVAYGNGLFVAVAISGTGNRVMTSPDAINWTARTSAADNDWYSVTYGNGLFVAVAYSGTGNRVMTSPDGITWTSRASAADTNTWRSVVYGNGLFVAVASSGTGNRVMTSPDGITWTSRASAADKSWYTITYGNGLFVAVASSGSGNGVMTSPDGIMWTLRTSPSNDWFSVTYGNGLFVAVAYSGTGNRVMTSPDGITWTSRASPADNNWRTVRYGNGLFVAIAYTGTGDRVMTSTPSFETSYSNNAVRFSFITPPDSDLSSVLVLKSTDEIGDTPLDGAIYATTTRIGNSDVVCSFGVATSTVYTCNSTFNTFNGTPYYFKFFTQDIYGNYSSAVMTSSTTPGRSITIGTGVDTASTTLAPGGAATTSDVFTLVTDQGTDALQSVVVTFASGTATSTGLLEITNDAGTIVYGSTTTPVDVTTLPLSGLSVTTATTTYRIRITPKSHMNMPPPSAGTTYALTTYISDWSATNIANKNGSDSSTTTITIDNEVENVDGAGVIWRNRVSASNNTWNSVTYGNGIFVAVSSTSTNQNVMTSPDGITWTLRNGTTTNTWTSVTYGNGLFVAVGSSGTGNRVMTSPDGITWTSRASSADNTWNSVTYGKGIFVAVSSSGSNRIMTSPDGITWTSRTSPENLAWRSVVYGNGLFVAVASTGTGNGVMTSSDGITWTSRTGPGFYGWRSVTYGKGIFVAVSSSATYPYSVMTSPDGINWTARTSTADINWFSVTYGNELFVAVAQSGASNRVMTSPDGITWTSRASAADNTWNSVTYGNELFVAVASSGADNRVMTSHSFGPSAVSSSNQITLTFINPADSDISTTTILRSTSPITDTPVEGVSYATSSSIGASTVVCSFAVTASSTRSCTDTGLTNGTPYYYKIFTQDTTGNWSTGVALDPVAPGDTGVTLGTGNDPVGGTLSPGGSATTSDTFTFQTTSGTDVIQAATVTFATGTAQALSLVEITSDNGATVYGSAANPASDIVPITLSTNTLTANTSLTQYRVRVTPKSHTNMPAVPGILHQPTSRITSWLGTTAYQTGSDIGATTTVLSLDNKSPENVDEVGMVWRSRASASNDSWVSVSYGNGLFVAVSATSSNRSVMTSPDGITWTLRTGTTTNVWRSVTYGNGLFVAVGSSTSVISNTVMTSPDGITWTSRTSAANNDWRSVTYGNGLFVAVSSTGTGNRVMTSPNGITWTSRASAADNSWYGVTYGNGLFVAVSNAGVGNNVMTSPDGITWTSRASAADDGWYSVTYGNGLFVAFAESFCTNDCMMTSPDGITWTTRVSAENTWRSVTYGDGLFVAVSYNGNDDEVMTSPDGITWTSRAGASDNIWNSVTYGNGLFVAVAQSGTGNRVMTSSSPSAISSSNQITLSFINPADTDISTTTILRSTSPITETPVEGVSYATSSSIGASTVACSFSVTASSTRTCTNTGLVNGTPYYFKLFVQDTTGNWSTGVALDPVAPGDTGVTLGTGNDPVGGTLSPGGSATTSDTFTFQTTSGTDVIQAATVTFATGTAQALSLVEITSDNGATVYGSAANPASDIVPITLSTNTLTANTSLTQYRVRVTPKSHTNMPAVPGTTYDVSSYISSFTVTAAYNIGRDQGDTIVAVDNESPAAPVGTQRRSTQLEQLQINYTSSATADAQDTLVLRSPSNTTDSPTEGENYVAGDTIGDSTVVCVASSSPLSARKNCTFSSPVRGERYYFKLFTKDVSGNYSSAASVTGAPFYIAAPHGGRGAAGGFVYERETQNGATTTVTGATGSGGGFGGTGTTTTATTTVSTTTPSKGGGGGDSGFLYGGSNLVRVFEKTYNFFLNQTTGAKQRVTAQEAVPASTASKTYCTLRILGACVIR